MIHEDEVLFIGTIGGRHGIGGEVELNFHDNAFDRGNAEYLFLNRDGILVPYFWEEYRFKNSQTAIFKFEDIDTEQQAKTLKGSEVFYPLKELGEEETFQSWKSLIGFNVTDEQGHTVGKITHIDDSSANIILTVEDPKHREILLPFHEDLLIQFMPESRTLQLRLPKGLLDLN